MNNLLGPLAALGSSVTWAVGVTFYSRLAVKYSPPTINLTRGLIAFSYFLIVIILKMGPAQGFSEFMNVAPHHWGWLLASIFSSYVLGDVLFFLSSVRIGVPSALAIASSYPIWSALEGAVFKGEHLRSLQWLGLFSTVAGVALVIVVGKKRGTPSQTEKNHFVSGVVLAFATSLLWSLNTYAVAQVGGAVSLNVMNAIRMGYAVLLCPVIGYFYKSQKFKWSLEIADIKKYGWVFIFEPIFGTVFFAYGLTYAPLGIASALSSLAPVMSAPIAWILKTEPVSFAKLAGILLVFAGIIGLVVF